MSDKKFIAILGAGESGCGAALLAKQQGYEVFVSDKGPIKDKYKAFLQEHSLAFEENQHSEERILQANEIIKSPGIPEKAPLIKKLREKGILIIDEIEFALRYTSAKIIGITGTNGKTTTTLLTYHILEKAGFNVGLAGNVGKSLALQVATENKDFYVVELSSFQLDGMINSRIHIAILTNITPDHLDRYEYKLENYVNSKFRILQNQTQEDAFIYCADDEITATALKSFEIKAQLFPFTIKTQVEQGAYLENNQIIIKTPNSIFTMFIEELALQGKHNTYNSMAAGIGSKLVEIRSESIRQSMSDMESVEHRMEPVAKVFGIQFINDSKATNVNSTWYALESMQTPTVWIAGGQDKGNDYNELRDLVKAKVKAIVCLGKDNSKIIEAFKDIVPTIVETDNADDAVRYSYKFGTKGDTVLLSPACASFDLFDNYEDRGKQFKRAVRAL
jgi:UDP-N-acetylmuramoylalanine--D-glutamate ligase